MSQQTLASVCRNATDDILFKVCKILSAVATQCEHAKMELGYPSIAFTTDEEDEARTLVQTLLEALSDDLPIQPNDALRWSSNRELTDHELEVLECDVADVAMKAIMDAAK